jgi:hypothetical protein
MTEIGFLLVTIFSDSGLMLYDAMVADIGGATTDIG